MVFDLGNVLVEWNPRLLLSEEFILETDFFSWNTELDRGAPFDELVTQMRSAHPRFGDEFEAFRERWPELIGDVISAAVDVLPALRARGDRLYVLSNSSAETLPRSDTVQSVLAQFDGVLVSGEVGLLKPGHEIFREAERRFALVPGDTWFVDDSQANVDAANACGWHGVHFAAGVNLLAELQAE